MGSGYDEAVRAGKNRRTARRHRRLGVLVTVALALGIVAAVPGWRGDLKDLIALGEVKARQVGEREPSAEEQQRRTSEPPAGPYDHLRATGKAKRILAVGRGQLGVEYVYGARPRHQWAVARIGRAVNRAGFDCSSFVAYVYQEALGEWIGGRVAHTDEIWTQGGRLPLTTTAGETSAIVRGTGVKAPPGGYRVGDIVFRREGAGGYWGHVAIVSERGLILESYPPDVHETRTLADFLAEDGAKLGWMRVRSLNP